MDIEKFIERLIMETQLTKLSDKNQIKLYFEGLLSLKKSGIEFPVDINDVWPLVYERKDNAIKALKESFIESIDYQLRQNAEVVSSNKLKNGVKADCFLTLSCLEYFIARKVRDVFEVYRTVFHKTIELSRKDLALMVIQSEEARELAEAKVKELTPKAEVYDQISDCTNLKTMGEIAKILHTGRTRLFEFLRERKILMNNNLPYQQYIDAGYFVVKAIPIKNRKEDYSQVFVKSKGELWLAKIF